PGHATDTAREVADQFIEKIISLHGIPKSIVSDSDSKFTGSFWQCLLMKLKIKPLMSLAFHPETDGQTERTNHTLEQFLRMYIDYRQSNWDEVLPFAEFAINNHMSVSTGKSPFFLNYGYHPSMTEYSAKEVTNMLAENFSQNMQHILTQATELLKKSQES